jgi:peptide/nickel transport system permease protein
MRRFDNPWANPKLIWGAGLLLGIIALGLLGRLFWDTDLVFTGAGMPRQAPAGIENMRGQIGTLAHPLGTDVSGKDLLALLIVGAPNTLYVGVLASLIGMSTASSSASRRASSAAGRTT